MENIFLRDTVETANGEGIRLRTFYNKKGITVSGSHQEEVFLSKETILLLSDDFERLVKIFYDKTYKLRTDL